jgi:hypothetical protein
MSIQSVHLDRLLEPLADCLSPEVAARIVAFADEATQQRIDDFGQRSSEGQLTDEERDEYAGYLHMINLFAILQAKARALLRKAA